MTNKNKHYLIAFAITTPILILISLIVVFNFTTIKDFITGIGYHPSTEMSEIRSSLSLTDTGQRIFNATMPELMEKQTFNQNCRERENANAILGCYRNDRIYVYDIIDDELQGIRELTSAHELLHAAYHRLSSEEKQKLAPILTQAYLDNQTVLGEEIDLYEDSEKQEELYVRLGTEIKNLPTELEEHYSHFFTDQDKIVDFYQSYIAIFRQIEQNLKNLLAEIEAKEAEINQKTATYEADAASLNKDIEEFNNCAKTPNCFTSNWTFNSKRQALINRENSLSALYAEINQMIADYNALVEEYNENALHGQSLNIKINSGATSTPPTPSHQ